MKSHKKALIAALVSVMGIGTIVAQPAGPDPTATVEVKARVNMSAVEMTAAATDLQQQVQLNLRRVLHLQEIARKQKDVIKLTCVNDRYVALKAEANLFDTAKVALDASIVGASDERFTHWDQVSERAGNIRKLREEADACVGEGDVDAESQSDWTGPDFPTDPTKGDVFDPELEPPAYASPYS